MPEFDFTQYKPDELDIYRLNRTSKKEILLDFTYSKVWYDAKAKCITLSVDKEIAFDYESELVEEADKGILQKSDEKGDNEPYNQETVAALAKLEKAFDIHYYVHNAGTAYNIGRDNSKNHLFYANALSGARVKIPLGQGLLDFCYFDEKKNMSSLMVITLLMDDDATKIITGKERAPITVRDSEEYHEILLHQLMQTLSASDFFYSSLYTAAFPPCFLKANDKSVRFYLNYLKILKQEFLDKIEFCFDEDYYPEVLGTMSPVERFRFYCRIKNIPDFFRSREEFSVVDDLSGDNLPNWLYGKFKIKPSEQFSDFCDKYGLNKDEVYNPKPQRTVKRTEVRSIFDMLNYEFGRMLESDIKIRKCKNCGKYFVLKGNYNTDFCDRLVEGSVRTCQAIGAEKVYKEKIATEESWKLYNKYYKRLFICKKINGMPRKFWF